MIHDAHNNARPTTTFHIRSFHCVKFHSLIHQLIIITHHTTTIKKEEINIAVITILLSDHINLGNALVVFTSLGSVFLVHIQSHINGTTVFSWIQSHSPETWAWDKEKIGPKDTKKSNNVMNNLGKLIWLSITIIYKINFENWFWNILSKKIRID